MAAVTPTSASGTVAEINQNTQAGLSLIPTGTTDGDGDTLVQRADLKWLCKRFDGVNSTALDTWDTGIDAIVAVRWIPDTLTDIAFLTHSGGVVTFTGATTDADGYVEVGFRG